MCEKGGISSTLVEESILWHGEDHSVHSFRFEGQYRYETVPLYPPTITPSDVKWGGVKQ